jgi:hypothetical protein
MSARKPFPEFHSRFWELYRLGLLSNSDILQIIKFIFVVHFQKNHCRRHRGPALEFPTLFDTAQPTVFKQEMVRT